MPLITTRIYFYLTLNNNLIINKNFTITTDNQKVLLDTLTYTPPLENLLSVINDKESIALRKHLLNKEDLWTIDDLKSLINDKQTNFEIHYNNVDKTLTTSLYDKDVNISLIIKQGVNDL